MKPLYLEPDEEITSVIEKVSALSDREIALVGPKNSALFQSLINLKLLAKEAKKLDKELVIIGSNKTGLRLAEQVGLKAFPTLGSVSEAPKVVAKAEELPAAEAPEVLPDGIKVNRYQPPVGGEIAAPATVAEEPENEPETAEEATETSADQPSEEPMPFTPVMIGASKPEIEPTTVEVGPEAAATDEGATDQPASADKSSDKEPLPAIVSHGYSSRTEFVIPWRSVIVASILLVIAFVLMIFFLPRARITVNFPATPVDQTISLTAAIKSEDNPDSLPASLVSSIQEATATIVSTGKKDIGTRATGSVSIKNCEDTTSHALAAGSKLTASGKSFTTVSAVTIPAGQFSNGGQSCNSTTVTAAITAAESGDTYNLGSTNFAISGLSSRFTATGSTSGGSTKEVTVLAQADIDKALAELKAQTTEKGTADIKTKAEGQSLIDSAILVTVKTQQADKKVGDQTDSAKLTYAAELSTLVFDGAAAQEKIRQIAGKDITEDKELIIPDSEQPALVFKSYNDVKTVLTFDAAVHGFIVTKVDKTDIAKSVARKRESDAKQILKDRFKASSSDIAVTPNWWFGRLPFLAAEISVEYGFSAPAE